MAPEEVNIQHQSPHKPSVRSSVDSTAAVTQVTTTAAPSDTASASHEANRQEAIQHGPSAQSSMDSSAAIAQDATTVEPSKSATPSVTFTEQQSPLLRLPAELRNRIHGEVFRLFFERLESRASTWGEQNPVDPKELRPLLCGLKVCRQFHQEAMTLLFRGFLARQPDWSLSEQRWISDLFLRTTSFCQTVERYAPHMRFSVALLRNPRDSFCPGYVKPLLEELARQLQEDVKLTFAKAGERPMFWYPARTETIGQLVWKPGHQSPGADDMSLDTAAWDRSWTSEDVRFQAKGSVGRYDSRYSWMNDCVSSGSGLFLDGCLAQLDWGALEKSVPYDRGAR
jgi:hypothetical protein